MKCEFCNGTGWIRHHNERCEYRCEDCAGTGEAIEDYDDDYDPNDDYRDWSPVELVESMKDKAQEILNV